MAPVRRAGSSTIAHTWPRGSPDYRSARRGSRACSSLAGREPRELRLVGGSIPPAPTDQASVTQLAEFADLDRRNPGSTPGGRTTLSFIRPFVQRFSMPLLHSEIRQN